MPWGPLSWAFPHWPGCFFPLHSRKLPNVSVCTRVCLFWGMRYFMSALAPPKKLHIMVSFCWIMLLIYILPQPNLLVTEQLLCLKFDNFITSTFMGGGSTLYTLPFLLGFWLSLLLVILQACCTGVLVSMCVKFRETGSFKGHNLLGNSQWKFAQHRHGKLLNFHQENIQQNEESSFTKMDSWGSLWHIVNSSAHSWA